MVVVLGQVIWARIMALFMLYFGIFKLKIPCLLAKKLWKKRSPYGSTRNSQTALSGSNDKNANVKPLVRLGKVITAKAVHRSQLLCLAVAESLGKEESLGRV